MKNLFYFLFFTILYSCSTESSTDEALQLNDSLFHVKVKPEMVLNTQTAGSYLSHLNKFQKSKLVVPVLMKELPVDSSYIMNYVDAQFISKQNMVNNFSAINIQVSGDDYDAIFYVVVNGSGNVISSLRLSGGLCAGPTDIKKNSTRYCPVRYSIIKNSEIKTFVITETVYLSTVKQPSVFDSVYYKSTVHANGSIDTKRVDSVRFTGIRK